MSRTRTNQTKRAGRRAAALLLSVGATCALLLPAPTGAQSQPTDSRPRRVSTTPAAPQTPRPPATPSPTPARTQTPKPSPTPQGPLTTPTLQVRPGAQVTPTPPPTPGAQEVDPEEYVRVESDLVNLNVRVIDRNNRPVGDVRQDEFRVFEDGVPQQIEFFNKEEVPISYGLVVDNSGSLRGQLNQVIDAAKTIINSNRPGDETFIVRFVSSDKIEVVQEFTADQNLLMDALDQLFIEGGQTAVRDAVMLAAERVSDYRKGDPQVDRRRRALILVTDGEDRVSYYNDTQLFDRLREMDVQIYVIGFTKDLEADNGNIIRKSSKDKAVILLNKLATETGGRAFFPASLADLPGIANEITRDLRTQYVVGYYPTNRARDGAYHAIRVQVADTNKRDKRIAITRSGRTAPRGGGNNPAAPPTPTPAAPTRRP